MTAEIAVMNKEAVALAADSAATMDSGRGPKIFTSANKIYALSLHAPVAVMVYGGASLLELPWETAIKLYRQRLADRTFGTLDEYANDFLDYLENSRALFPVDAQERHVAYTVFTFLRELRREI